MKKLIIDTGGAANDAVAILMTLREPAVKVLAITTTYGQAGIEQANRIALLAVKCAQRCSAPVYQGIAKPLRGDVAIIGNESGRETAAGADLRAPTQPVEMEHAVDAIARLARQSNEALELLCLGPLTNIAYAMLQFPQVMNKIARITVMGGAHFFSNAYSACAEFNILADPEAASIVFGFGVPLTVVIRDAGKSVGAALTAEESEQLHALGELGALCVEGSRSENQLAQPVRGNPELELPGATAFAVLAKPELVKSSFESETIIELGGTFTRGTSIFRRQRAYFESKPVQSNSTVVTEVLGQEFKRYVFRLIREEQSS